MNCTPGGSDEERIASLSGLLDELSESPPRYPAMLHPGETGNLKANEWMKVPECFVPLEWVSDGKYSLPNSADMT